MMKQDLKRKRLFYGRVIVSISLFCAFIISSVMDLLIRGGESGSLVIGGLLIGAVLFLPRSTRRVQRGKDAPPEDHDFAHLRRVQNWLTGVRFVYMLGALFVWVLLPSLI